MMNNLINGQIDRTILRQRYLRYAKIADLVYLINDTQNNLHIYDYLARSNCLLDETSIQKSIWKNGFQAICVECPTTYGKELVVAFRGAASPVEFMVDMEFINHIATPAGGAGVNALLYPDTPKISLNWAPSVTTTSWQVKEVASRITLAFEYYNRFVAGRIHEYNRVIIVGHSLGGLLATHVAYQKNVIAHTFNTAPGAKYTLVTHKDEVNLAKAIRIHNHRIIGDFVSQPPTVGNYNGYPYGHLGVMYNWKSVHQQYGLSIHCMQSFYDMGFAEDYLSGTSAAPTNSLFW
jgi:hypothetical protein